MKTFYWLVKREFWEHKGGFFWAPVVTGIVFLALNIMGIVLGEVFGRRNNWGVFKYGGTDMHATMSVQDMNNAGAVMDISLYAIAAIVLCVTAIVVFFYCLGALYDDRRDRSILFWKSLPVSDTATVLSKVVSATVVAPLIAVVVGALTGLVMLLMFAITLSLHGVSVWHLLGLSHPLQVMANLVGSIPLYVLWALPTVGWLMLCSAWARSKPFLWAVALPVGVGIVIGWFNLLGTLNISNDWYWRGVVARILGSVFPGGWFSEVSGIGGADPAAVLSSLSVLRSYTALGSANLWIGVVAAVAMLAGAIWFRRWRDDS